jgi:glycosyltransferase involved in cell wall biosynthesis
VRVLHVVATNGRRGAETFARDLIRATEGPDLDQHVAVVRGSQVGALEFGVPTTLLGPPGGGPRSVLHPLRAEALRRLLVRLRPHVVLAHGGEALKHAVLARGGLRCPIVYRKIGETLPWARRGIRRALHRALLRRASAVVIVAEALRAELQELYRVPPQRVVHIPNGVDPGRLRPTRSPDVVRGELGVGVGDALLTSVIALVWEKDPLSHLAAGAQVLSRRPQARFLLVGDGPLRARVEEEARRREVGDRILVLGSRADVPDLLGASDLLLLASARGEGAPGCLIEAGMLGVPAVSYAVAGVSEVVLDGRTGLLARAGDLDALVRLALDLLADEGRRRTLGEEARAWCGQAFDIRTVAPRYLDVYERVAWEARCGSST